MKTNLFDVKGNKKSAIEIPEYFTKNIRADLVAKVIESRKNFQPYAPSPTAGKWHSARGKQKHRRHVWKSLYGRGGSRVPRKILSRRGSQFSWIGATSPNTRGGLRAHPPKIEHFNKIKKINKNELKIAFISALSASARGKLISRRYLRLNDEKIENAPFIVEHGLSKLKSKELIECIKKILGEKLFEIAINRKTQRAGRGKLRGRKYKKNAGLLIVIGKNEKIKTGAFDVAYAENLGVSELARGGLGRLVLYSEDALEEINERLNPKKKIKKEKFE